jgi:hypothetical protein
MTQSPDPLNVNLLFATEHEESDVAKTTSLPPSEVAPLKSTMSVVNHVPLGLHVTSPGVRTTVIVASFEVAEYMFVAPADAVTTQLPAPLNVNLSAAKAHAPLCTANDNLPSPDVRASSPATSGYMMLVFKTMLEFTHETDCGANSTLNATVIDPDKYVSVAETSTLTAQSPAAVKVNFPTESITHFPMAA